LGKRERRTNSGRVKSSSRDRVNRVPLNLELASSVACGERCHYLNSKVMFSSDPPSVLIGGPAFVVCDT
jgi:hypothetical protein